MRYILFTQESCLFHFTQTYIHAYIWVLDVLLKQSGSVIHHMILADN